MSKEQIEVLSEQLHWAKDLGLPVSLHTRNAFHDMFKVLDHEQDGRLAVAEAFAQGGFLQDLADALRVAAFAFGSGQGLEDFGVVDEFFCVGG